MKRLLLITSFLLLSWLSQAQTYTLHGTVSKNGAPSPGVSVSIKNSDKGTITTKNGSYVLYLQAGEYQVVFRKGNQKTIPITLTADRVLNVDMTDATTALAEVLISSIRVDADSPITHSNMTETEINERNLGQSIPVLMNYMPNVVTTSDAGAGVGYTGMRVRGSDGTRINVTINGVPMNDSESQSTVWVDLGDFSNSVESLQLQRGVGTSTNGAGAFGASLNVVTKRPEKEASAQITNTYGSFNTHKHQVSVNTGTIGDHFAFSGNVSQLQSDGYRDRAFSDLKSYMMQGVYFDDNTLIKLLSFGGSEQTYQAYYGISADKLAHDRTFNPAGMYTDSTGTTQFYDNQTDNYKQDHLQLVWSQAYNSNWSSNLTFHYTYGRGYYESFREDADLEAHGLSYFDYQGNRQKTSDMIDQKWLSNHFYGAVFNLTYEDNRLKTVLGGGWNKYLGDHYGNVIYSKFSMNNLPYAHYYDNYATKNDFNIYGKVTYALTDDLFAYGDLQWRRVSYHTQGLLDEGQPFYANDELSFFNPKFGLTYQLNPVNQLYASYARANREPSRADYKSAVLSGQPYPKAESLNDFELGWRFKKPGVHLNANLYYMDYHNQLVLTGAIDNEGSFIRENSGESYRLGLEINAIIRVSDNFEIRPNISFSQNRNLDYKTTINGDLKGFGNTAISFSPQIVGGNMLRYSPVENLQLNFLTKFVGEQYLSNTEAEGSTLDSYLVNSFNAQYTWTDVPLFKEAVFSLLVNNIFDEKYVSNGYYSPGYGASYYPQAGINFLTGLTLKF